MKTILPLDMEPAERRRVSAYHEAGHAALAWHLGLGVAEVRLNAASGHSDHAMGADQAIRKFGECDARRRLALVQLAGIWSQRKKWPKVDIDGAYQDSTQANANMEQIAKLSGTEFSVVQGQIHTELNTAIHDLWPVIEAVAERLLAGGVILGVEFEQVAQPALGKV